VKISSIPHNQCIHKPQISFGIFEEVLQPVCGAFKQKNEGLICMTATIPSFIIAMSSTPEIGIFKNLRYHLVSRMPSIPGNRYFHRPQISFDTSQRHRSQKPATLKTFI
jgi:hypothetical protein